MTFRNTASLFVIFLLLLSCKGVQYYQSGTNPAAISVVMDCPSIFYTNKANNEKVSFYLINNNPSAVVISHWWTDLWVIGQSRFYNKEIRKRAEIIDRKEHALTLEPGEKKLLISISINDLLSNIKNWYYRDKLTNPPHIVDKKNYFPYVYFTSEFQVKIPNQEQVINIRSEKKKVEIKKWEENKITNKKSILSISSNVSTFHLKDKMGNLTCKISNLTDYPITLFNDAGSVKFKIYAYNPNRTAIMHTQFVLADGKLPVNQLTIQGKSEQSIIIPLSEILFLDPPSNPIYYWSWNKKKPPVSPLIYGEKDIATIVELWFGIVVDGQEFLSNTLSIAIDAPIKKSKKNQ